MILAFIGGVVILITATHSDLGIAGYIVGGVMVLLGLCAMRYIDDEVKARHNRRKYWASGGPDRSRKYCPACGASVGQSDRYCRRCGRHI